MKTIFYYAIAICWATFTLTLAPRSYRERELAKAKEAIALRRQWWVHLPYTDEDRAIVAAHLAEVGGFEEFDIDELSIEDSDIAGDAETNTPAPPTLTIIRPIALRLEPQLCRVQAPEPALPNTVAGLRKLAQEKGLGIRNGDGKVYTKSELIALLTA